MVDGLEPSDNFDALVNVMNNFEYDGPEYSPQTTVDALDFVTKFASRSPAGVAKVFVVMAPESQETVRKSFRRFTLIRKILTGLR